MASRMQERKERAREHHHQVERASTDTAQGSRAREHEDLKHDLDDLLEDIDAVLEENAEEFVAAYVQRGGQ